MKSGYDDAVKLAREKLIKLASEKVCKLCGVEFDGEKYIIKWLSKDHEVYLDNSAEPGYSRAHEIIFLHYLTSEGTKQPEGKLIPYREIPGALFYEPKFIQRTVNPVVKCFGRNPERLIKTGKLLGGVESREGGASAYSVKINVLPYLPVTYMIRAGDDEFDPAGTVLFDKTASGWLNAEDLVYAASFAAYELIGKCKNIYK